MTIRTRKFYDFSIHTAPECSDSPEAMAETASGYGYAGIAITNHTPHQPQKPAMTDHPKIAVYSGIEIVAKNPHHLMQMIRKHRAKVRVLAVHGGNEKINRAAVESRAVDILSHPDERLNHVLMRFASENRVAIEFNLDSIIRMRGRARVRALTNFRHNLKLARKYGAPMILASSAQSIYDLRAPAEMIALGTIFGMTEDEAIAALSTVPEEIIRRGSENWIMEGVEIVG
ncbi:MAG: ribonuclease P protein component 3 [Candidatus Syntropharchaeales archaeon]